MRGLASLLLFINASGLEEDACVQMSNHEGEDLNLANPTVPKELIENPGAMLGLLQDVLCVGDTCSDDCLLVKEATFRQLEIPPDCEGQCDELNRFLLEFEPLFPKVFINCMAVPDNHACEIFSGFFSMINGGAVEGLLQRAPLAQTLDFINFGLPEDMKHMKDAIGFPNQIPLDHEAVDLRNVAGVIHDGDLSDLLSFLDDKIVSSLGALMKMCATEGEVCDKLGMLKSVTDTLRSCHDSEGGEDGEGLCKVVLMFEQLVRPIAEMMKSEEGQQKLLNLERVKRMMSCDTMGDDDGKCEGMKNFQRVIALVAAEVERFAVTCSKDQGSDEEHLCEALISFAEMIGPLLKEDMEDPEEEEDGGSHMDMLLKFKSLFGEKLTGAIAGILEACSKTDCARLHELTDIEAAFQDCDGKGDEQCQMMFALKRLFETSAEFVSSSKYEHFVEKLESDMMESREMQMVMAEVAHFFVGFGHLCPQDQTKQAPYCPLIEKLTKLFQGESETEDPEEFNCLTKEVWSEQKQVWCCTNKSIGCPNPKTSYCSFEKAYQEERREWCCKFFTLHCTKQEAKAMSKQDKHAKKAKRAFLKDKRKCAKAAKQAAKEAKQKEKEAKKKSRKNGNLEKDEVSD